MRISTRGRYALTAMIYIAKSYNSDNFVSLNEISKSEGISSRYLEKIMNILKKANFFIVSKGKDGGYRLRRKPSEYSIGEIIRVAEGGLDIVSCVGDDLCPKKGICVTYPLWKGLSDEINEYLDGKSLEDYM